MHFLCSFVGAVAVVPICDGYTILFEIESSPKIVDKTTETFRSLI